MFAMPLARRSNSVAVLLVVVSLVAGMSAGFGCASLRHESHSCTTQSFSSAHITEMIEACDAWPSTTQDNWAKPFVEYSDAAWCKLVRTAVVLQKTPCVVVEQALQEYMTKHGVSSGMGCITEWTKPLLLLRVMFQLPESEVEEEAIEKYGMGAMGFGGFGPAPPLLNPTDPESGEREVPVTFASPLSWTPRGPKLVARLGNYNGSPYAASEEYQFFLKHFPFRSGLEHYLARRPSE